MIHARSLLLSAPCTLDWIAEDLRDPGPGEVLLRTEAGAISVGSELPLYRGVARHHEPVTYPRMTGYENVATVVAAGPGVAVLQPGDRVFAFYGHRTYAVVDAARAVRVPPGTADELALIAILTCDVTKGIQRVAPKAGEAVLVTGAGALGVLTVAMLRAVGARDIDVVERQDDRQALPRTLGARVVGPPEAFAGDGGYGVGFECSSTDAGFALLQRRMDPFGRICVIADGNVEPLTLAPAFHAKELQISGTSDGRDYREHARWYFERAGAFPAITGVFDLAVDADSLPQTFEALAAGAIRPRKVFVRYG